MKKKTIKKTVKRIKVVEPINAEIYAGLGKREKRRRRKELGI